MSLTQQVNKNVTICNVFQKILVLIMLINAKYITLNLIEGILQKRLKYQLERSADFEIKQ